MTYDNNNRGSIWKNDRREKNTHPHFTGTATVEGREYWVSAWKREDGANPKSPALRFSFKPKDETPRREPTPSPPENEDIPF